LWGSNTCAIDMDGNFQGAAGAVIQSILEFMFDLKSDFKISVAILALLTLPQIFNYILSGLFGCASIPVLFKESISFFVWGLVKSFVIVAGILLSMTIFGLYYDWFDWTWMVGIAYLFVSVMLIFFSFCILVWYRDSEGLMIYLQKICSGFFRKQRVKIHKWFTRKMGNQDLSGIALIKNNNITQLDRVSQSITQLDRINHSIDQLNRVNPNIPSYFFNMKK